MSTRSPSATPSPRRDKPLNRWHRNAGVAAAGMVVYLLVTGMPLQFSAELGLAERYVDAGWILDWYGLQAPERVVRSGEVVQVGEWLYTDDAAATTAGPLAGAVGLADFIVVAAADELLVLPRGVDAPPERSRVAGPVRRIGERAGVAYLDTARGLLASDAMLLNWASVAQAPRDIRWASVETLGPAAAAPFRSRFRSHMLNLERWLQDLHSGRFFGAIGVLFVDVAAVLMLTLAATGLLLWWRYRRY